MTIWEHTDLKNIKPHSYFLSSVKFVTYTLYVLKKIMNFFIYVYVVEY